jgi:hypothetical protein
VEVKRVPRVLGTIIGQRAVHITAHSLRFIPAASCLIADSPYYSQTFTRSTMANINNVDFGSESEEEGDFNPAPADPSDEEGGSDNEIAAPKLSSESAPRRPSPSANDDEDDEDEAPARRAADDDEDDDEEGDEEEDDDDEVVVCAIEALLLIS